MSSENLFNYGKSSQSAIIKPYIDLIRKEIGFKMGEDEIDYFISKLNSCSAMLSEHEVVPKWVKDLPTYRMKSEISAFLSMFSALKIANSPTSDEKDLLARLYSRVREFGKERDWDLQILHIQFIRVMGSKVQNYIIQLVLPRKLESIDYN